MPVANQYTALNNIAGGGPMGSGNRFTTMYSADPDIAAQGAQSLKLAEAQGAQARQTAAQGNQFKTDRLNQFLPLFQQGLAGSMAAANGGAPAGPVGTGPTIHGGPIWTQQGINQNINANNARIDQQTATNNQVRSGQMAGKGFGSRSPLAMALEAQGAQSAMGQKADYAREFVPQTRQANAGYALNVGQAQEAQHANREQEAIGRQQAANQRFSIAAQQQNSLLNALGGLLS